MFCLSSTHVNATTRSTQAAYQSNLNIVRRRCTVTLTSCSSSQAVNLSAERGQLSAEKQSQRPHNLHLHHNYSTESMMTSIYISLQHQQQQRRRPGGGGVAVAHRWSSYGLLIGWHVTVTGPHSVGRAASCLRQLCHSSWPAVTVILVFPY